MLFFKEKYKPFVVVNCPFSIVNYLNYLNYLYFNENFAFVKYPNDGITNQSIEQSPSKRG